MYLLACEFKSLSTQTESLIRSRSNDFFNKPLDASTNNVKLFVKHVFITSDLGEYALPKWASWVRVIIDGTHLQ